MPGRKPINQKRSKVKEGSRNVPIKGSSSLRPVLSGQEQLEIKRLARDSSGYLLSSIMIPISPPEEENIDERPR
jgi:hypothetical protein